MLGRSTLSRQSKEKGHQVRADGYFKCGGAQEEEESPEEGIPTFEMIQKNPASGKEQELED